MANAMTTTTATAAELTTRSQAIADRLTADDAPVHAVLGAACDATANDAIVDAIGHGPAIGRAHVEYKTTPTCDLRVLSGIRVEGHPVHGQANCSQARVVTMGSTSVTGDFRHELGHAILFSLTAAVYAHIQKLHAASKARAQANPAGLVKKLDHEFYETQYGVIGRRAMDSCHEDFAEHYRGYQKAVYRTRTGEDPQALARYASRFPEWSRFWDAYYTASN